MMLEEQKEMSINQDDMTLPVPAIHFAVKSHPSGEALTGLKNVSPAYVNCRVLAEIRFRNPANKGWIAVSEAPEYPYNGRRGWTLPPDQEFHGSLNLPGIIRNESGEKYSVGALIDTLDGAWLRIELVEEQRSITGKRIVTNHPSRFFHWSSSALCWIPEPCDTGS